MEKIDFSNNLKKLKYYYIGELIYKKEGKLYNLIFLVNKAEEGCFELVDPLFGIFVSDSDLKNIIIRFLVELSNYLSNTPNQLIDLFNYSTLYYKEFNFYYAYFYKLKFAYYYNNEKINEDLVKLLKEIKLFDNNLIDLTILNIDGRWSKIYD